MGHLALPCWKLCFCKNPQVCPVFCLFCSTSSIQYLSNLIRLLTGGQLRAGFDYESEWAVSSHLISVSLAYCFLVFDFMVFLVCAFIIVALAGNRFSGNFFYLNFALFWFINILQLGWWEMVRKWCVHFVQVIV